jgi:hypothetical protein
MKEIWSKNPELIQHEIEALIAEKTVLSLYQPGHPPVRALISGIEDSQGEKVLLLAKKELLRIPKESCLALYPVPRSPMRAFKCLPLFETQDQLGVPFPADIVQIQRRKHPRIVTSTHSTVVFAKEGTQALHNGIVKDVCMDGARLSGDFPEHIHAGDHLGPLSMTLRLTLGNHEENFTIPKARLCRAVDLKDNIREFGIHFDLDATGSERLERYITMRILEDRPRKSR